MWPGFDSRTRRHMWVEFVVGSRSCSERFFSGSPVFPSPQKPTFPNSNSIDFRELNSWKIVCQYGVPQDTKLGPWLFILMINDLVSHETLLWKYVDDTTVSEVVPKEQTSNVQEIVDRVVDWSKENKFQLNRDKCKELRISFAKNKVDLPHVG